MRTLTWSAATAAILCLLVEAFVQQESSFSTWLFIGKQVLDTWSQWNIAPLYIDCMLRLLSVGLYVDSVCWACGECSKHLDTYGMIWQRCWKRSTSNDKPYRFRRRCRWYMAGFCWHVSRGVPFIQVRTTLGVTWIFLSAGNKKRC